MHGSEILHKQRGCEAPPKLSQSFFQAREDVVCGEGYSGGVGQLGAVNIRPYHQCVGWTK